MHTELFFCYMPYAQNLSYIHILYTQKGVYIIFEYKKNFKREAFRFSMVFKIFRQIKHFDFSVLSKLKLSKVKFNIPSKYVEILRKLLFKLFGRLGLKNIYYSQTTDEIFDQIFFNIISREPLNYWYSAI